ncbi:DNA-binding protein [Aliarcobacter butzleri]|uniref:helix-turn-helix domain-containing protein n=1 Tax=Aliarcobacter butzleri TaxID=28197 RepID=UPI001ED9D4B8|nr:DNA-binding protein [Aliarcobacter butzleri]MCG3706302.1 DNA-binding protein [Aliarcobacter butzleri]MCT7567821.1 DNA-binding protein [Aliarcobacter butzleri]
MQLKIIKNEKEYDEALNRIDELMELNPELGTKESDELEILVLLVEKYEEINWNISTPDPIEAIKYRMEEMNLKQKDLVPYIGNKSKVSELLNRKISLSLSMVRSLSEALHIPLEILVKPI